MGMAQWASWPVAGSWNMAGPVLLCGGVAPAETVVSAEVP